MEHEATDKLDELLILNSKAIYTDKSLAMRELDGFVSEITALNLKPLIYIFAYIVINKFSSLYSLNNLLNW